ncbi:hypothetical protein CTA2_4296, partial [Colletotrichum tanaceti]
LSEPQLLGADDAAYTLREKRAEDFAKRCKKNGEDVGRFMGTYSNAVDHYTVMKADNRTKMGLLGRPAPSSLAYTVTTAQPSQIRDAERGLDAFFYTCLRAPANCSFAGSATTPAELRSRYTALETKLKTKPLLGGAGTDNNKFDWSALHSFLTLAIHGPGWFPVLSNVLTEAETGAVGGWIGYVLTGVLRQGQDDFKSYFQSMTDAAPSVASIFSEWRLVCSKWKIDPVNKLDDTSGGPVTTQGKFVVLNGVGDPASSVEGAKGVVARFSPGVLVKTLAAGHTSFAATSNCLFGVFYTFFVLGQMPAEGTTCGDLFAAPFGVQLPPSF